MTSVPRAAIGPREFIALIAMMFATVAFSIDAMLPALPDIAAELAPTAPNRAQLVITAFLFGLGAGTAVVGPVSDAMGRKRVIVAGAVLYVAGAVLAAEAVSLPLLLAARVLQGFGCAAPRIVTLAMVRDLHSGREMARIVSFALMIFTLGPAVAPLLGTAVIAGFGWRGIFGALVVFSLVSVTWLMLRLPETLPPERRRPLRLGALVAAFREVLRHRVVVIAILVQAMVFGTLFGVLSSTQQTFAAAFDRAASFPLWFGVIALCAGAAGFVNARVVGRLGIRRVVSLALAIQALTSLVIALITAAALWPEALAFPAYLLWTVLLFGGAGMMLGNLNALALEPVGHIAGMAASVTGSVATVLGVALAAPVGLAFDGTPVPLAVAVTLYASAGLLLMRALPRQA